jgi:hypothetical protein
MHPLGFREAPVALALGPKELEPTLPRKNVRSARVPRERVVLGDAMLDQPGIAMGDLVVLGRTRIEPVLPEERREARQR